MYDVRKISSSSYILQKNDPSSSRMVSFTVSIKKLRLLVSFIKMSKVRKRVDFEKVTSNYVTSYFFIKQLFVVASYFVNVIRLCN